MQTYYHKERPMARRKNAMTAPKCIFLAFSITPSVN